MTSSVALARVVMMGRADAPPGLCSYAAFSVQPGASTRGILGRDAPFTVYATYIVAVHMPHGLLRPLAGGCLVGRCKQGMALGSLVRRQFMLKSSEYEATHKKSLEDKESFWMDYALKRIEWFKEPTQALDSSKAPFYKWFPDGEVNLCHNALDRHIASRGDQTAIAYDSAVGGKSRLISYNTLLDEVSKFAGALAGMGVETRLLRFDLRCCVRQSLPECDTTRWSEATGSSSTCQWCPKVLR